MLPSERKQALLRELEQRGGVTVADFASRMGVSGMTVRRDLFDLERDGLVTRVHGGAVRREKPTPARGTSSGRTPSRTLGLIVPSASYYFPGFIAGAKAAAAEENVRLVLAVSEYQPEIEQEQIRRLIQLGVDGLIVTPTGEETYPLLAESKLPVMVMERSMTDVPGDFPLGGVRSHHAHGAALAVHHLVECGRSRLGLVSVRTGVTADPVHAGFRKAVDELLPDSPHFEFDLDGVLGTAEQRRSVFADCMKAGVDGILVFPDAVAIAMAELAMDHGINVPGDLAIVAYDDEIASLSALPLTAVSPPKFDVGASAVRMCVELINQRSGASRLAARGRAQAQVMLLPSLELRESSFANTPG